MSLPLFKHRHAILRASTALLIPAALIPSAAQAQGTPPAPAGAAAADSANAMGDIIVTANRRQERNQDVPIAITALSPQRLEQQGIKQEQDLQANIPSLVVGPNGQGSREAQSFTIRGQGATFQASPGVVVYLNEVPLPSGVTLSQQGGPGNFVDLESLQVLSGPQGTLFGRNTTGGAVLLVPKKPTSELGGWVQGRIGNYQDREVEGALNLPVVEDKLLVRVVGAYHDRDGYTRDVTFNKDRDNTHWYSGRIGITFKPTDGIENYLMVYGSRSSNNGAGFIHKGYNIDGLKALNFCQEGPTVPFAIVSCDVYRAATDKANELGPRATAFSNDIFSKTTTWGASNTTNVELSDAVTVRNIVSFQKLKLDYSYDSDGTVLQQHDVDPNRLPAPGQVTLPGTNLPVTYLNSSDQGLPRDNLKQFTEELQLQGNALDRKLTYTVGGFYFDARPDGAQGGTAIVYCPGAFTGLCTPNDNRYRSSQRSKAVYVQGTLDLGALTPALDTLRLTGGYRRTWDTIKGAAGAYTPNADGLTGTCASDSRIVPIANATADCTYTATLKSKASTWTVGLDYKLQRDILVYGKVSRGYKAGGFNLQAVFVNTRTFDPETVTSYEIGTKADFRLADIPFRVNASGYILDYKDIQRAGGDFNPVSGSGGAVVHNADARVKGIELEASVRPIRGVELGGNFSYTHARYKTYQFATPTGQLACNGVVPAGGTVDLACLPFQYVSPYIWSMHVSAEHRLEGDLGTLNLFVNYSHTARQYTDPGNLPSTQPGAYLGAFGLLNMSLDWNNIAGKGFDAGLFVTNATNKLYRISNTNVFQQGGLLYQSALYGEPRMYGFKLRYRFGGE